ncbi:Signal transduction histidine kinase [Friedmanniella luteola]|uniref:histidine kinase n=1 Tax=Friedmanniella luteola TaxID=546871 RepID=A0A1H2A917_9ACTN|nr:sensor histidine kinase [Friedmanniella luteola]SDT42354.1 Signal transduction histidine kinase [Friedmanniella luteola]
MSSRLDLQVRDRRFVWDFVLACVVAVVVSLPYATGGEPAAAAASVILASALLMRRLVPAAALAVGAVGALGQLLTLSQPMIGIVVVPMLVYAAARWGSRSVSHAGLALGLAGALLGPARWALPVYSSSTAMVYFAMGVTGCAGVVLAAYLVGRRGRESVENRRERQLSELERSRLRLAEQEQRAAVAAVDERNRIARELHDIVAHSLSVIVVQAEGGRALAAKRPEKGPEVLGTIAETSREALEEMRRMVGLLRSGGPGAEPTSYVPTPGLDDIPDLVRKTSATARLATFGTAPPVSQALGLTAYRIVQEAMTNTLKHAGPAATAQVTLAFTGSALEIEVSDDGRGAAATGDGRGHGLRGMHERVALHGGTLTAGPRPTGGYSVRVSLPLTAAPAAQPGPSAWTGR